MTHTVAHTNANHGSSSHLSIKRAMYLGLFLLVLYVLIPQIGSFRSSFSLLKRANGWWVVAGLMLSLATYFTAAVIYRLLAKQPLKYVRTVIVQAASMFANRLLPAGIGAMGVNYEYLRKNKHKSDQAATVVAANNTIGIIGHLLLLAVCLSIAGEALDKFRHFHITLPGYSTIIIIGVVAIVLSIILKLKGRNLYHQLKRIAIDLAGYRNNPIKIVVAVGFSVLLTSLYVLTLLSCVKAVGVNLDFVQSLIVLTFGVAGGTVIPTPGGLGGAEAGLVVGLLACRVSGADALAAVLIYRFITYWFALVFGAISLGVAKHMKYL